MTDVLIPPWIRPVTPERVRLIDDASVGFQPAFGRGVSQRGSWGDPRWGFVRKYEAMRSDELATMGAVLDEMRGQLNTILGTIYTPDRGSFPSSEMLSNPTFASSVSGWDVTSGMYTLSVQDRVLTARRWAGNGANQMIIASAVYSCQPHRPYLARYFVSRGQGSYSYFRADLGASSNGAEFAVGSTFADGMVRVWGVATTGTLSSRLVETDNTGPLPGDHLRVPFTSLSQCALVDNGLNLLQWSDDLTHSPWLVNTAAVTANAATAPDGTTTANKITSQSPLGGAAYAYQRYSTAQAVDYCFSVAVKAGLAPRAYVSFMAENSPNFDEAAVHVDLSSGTQSTSASAITSSWLNPRAFVASMGNGWWQVSMIATRKASAVNTFRCLVACASGSGVITSSGAYIYAWRATLAQASVPTRLIFTNSATAVGSPQIGSTLFLKGLPPNSAGLRLTGDWLEVNGELKRLTGPLDSDGCGLGTARLRPSLVAAPNDNDPVVFSQPFGRFKIGETITELQNRFGLYGDVEMTMEEVYQS